MKTWFKNNSSHLIVIAIFCALVFFYFTPVWQGKALSQHDVVQAVGAQKEIFDFKSKDGHGPQWTNAMFGGMPTYQIWFEHTDNIATYLNKTFRFAFPLPADIILLFLLGGYFLLSVLRIKPWLAAVGAIAIAFSSYNIIYIEAGHITKAYAIAYMAPIIGAVIMTYRGNKALGGVLLALFLALEIRCNHLQMTYYLFIALLVLVFAELYYAIRDKKIKGYVTATAWQVGAVILAVVINASVIFPTYEYSKLTTRGKANIVKVEDAGDKKTAGLDREYAYVHSQGVGENITFLIPNAYGSKSGGVLGEKSHAVKFFTDLNVPKAEAMQMAYGLPTYWGEKPFTSGPWYFGAGVFFLFIVGLIVVKDRLKWWIVIAGSLVLLLSFGKNFPLVSDLFFDYVPMYNKFRAVESILVIVSVLIPLLAIMAVNELINRGNEIIDLDKKLLYSFAGVGGLCLIVALMPSLLLDFKPANFNEFIAAIGQQLGDNTLGNNLANALIKDRSDIASSDGWRSFFIVTITFGLVWLFIKKKMTSTVLIVAIGVVTLLDLWSVDKRFLNSDTFVEKKVSQNPFQEREVDQLINLDKDLSYRVLDMTTNPFSDARASYYHKNLGGYHAAKLMRFQEVLENQFNGAINEDVLDMFNVRYVITKDQNNGSERIQRRNTASGNAWFVDKVTFVRDNAQEMQAISSFDPMKEAFVHEEFKNKFDVSRLGKPVNAKIDLVSYHPDRMKYEYTAPNDVFAVFSEIIYEKGWKAYVDGKELPIIRANYILRGLQLPGGNHTVEFVFDPQTMKISNIASLIGSIILVLGLFVTIYFIYRKKKA